MHRRTFLAASAATAAASSVALAGPASAAPTVLRTLASGLDIPWGLDFLPDGSALFTERDKATISRLTPDGTRTVIGTLPGVVPNGEAGLLGLAVSPTYATDRRVYLYASTRNDNRVGWLTYDGSTLGTYTPIVTGIAANSNHNGGSLLWTRSGDGLLIGTGDALDKSKPQDVTSLNGKILRVDRSGAARPTNPFAGSTRGDDRIYSYGHRNPEGLATNTAREIWSAELGENIYDELNQILRGRNYGWPNVQGSDGPGGYTDPLAQWPTSQCSPSGVAVLAQRAYVGALGGQSLYVVDLHGANRGRKQRFLQGELGRIRNVKVAPDKTLWVTTSNGGDGDKIVQLQP